jgi:hypothetical protein
LEYSLYKILTVHRADNLTNVILYPSSFFLWLYSILILVDVVCSIARFHPFLFCKVYIIAYISACFHDGKTVISGNTDTPQVFQLYHILLWGISRKDSGLLKDTAFYNYAILFSVSRKREVNSVPFEWGRVRYWTEYTLCNCVESVTWILVWHKVILTTGSGLRSVSAPAFHLRSGIWNFLYDR